MQVTLPLRLISVPKDGSDFTFTYTKMLNCKQEKWGEKVIGSMKTSATLFSHDVQCDVILLR